MPIKEKRLNILIYLIIALFLILFIKLFYIQIIKHEYYQKQYLERSENIVYGSTAPRGRMYDRYHRLIVDNIPVKTIYYEKESGITTKEEIEIAYTLAEMIDVDYSKLNDNILKNFWIKKNPSLANEKITEEEYLDLKYRKLTGTDIEQLKKERITIDELNTFNNQDKEASYIYYLMNKGYSYSTKIIKKGNITEEEYAKVATSNIKGVRVRLDWERYYPYGSVFKSIMGSISTNEVGIPEDLKDYYMDKGYNLNDRVGISYLEYQYDDYLKGEKNAYKINKDGSKTLIKEGTKGNDLVLTIDIELQKEVEKILEEELLKTKKEPNTEYYNRSFVIINDPMTGEILAMAGKQIKKVNGEYIIYDYTPGIFTSSVVVGSIIKGASHIVGYNTGALKIGEVRYDTCVKLKNAPAKCSWTSLGSLNDLTALKMSSNTYQFYTALKVAGVNYVYDMPFKVEQNIFDIYRNTFSEFGLGVKTGIDLPNESTGLKGTKTDGGLLLDFSIGQYDNYTPLELAQYMSTIANNGERMQFYLVKNVEDKTNHNSIYQMENKVLNKINTEQIYLDRVKEGFKLVMDYGGTGSGYINKEYHPAGKTGTSQSFVDTDLDGKIDTETVSNTFSAYAPYENPKVVFTVVSPDVYNYGSSYISNVNKRISQKISQKYFEIYS